MHQATYPSLGVQVASRAHGRGSRTLGSILLAAHAFAFVYGKFENELLAATAVASTGVLLAAWYAVERRSLAGMAPVLAFVFGNAVVFGYANLGYVELTDQPRGEYHELTAWLAAVLVWATCISAVGMDALLGRERIPKLTDLVTRWQTMALGTVLFSAMAVMYVASGTFNGRYEVTAQSEWIYYFQATFGLVYVFFFLLGSQMKGSIVAPRNVAIVTFVVVLAFLQGLSGGREPSLMMCAFLLLGAALGPLHRNSVLALGALVVVFSIVFVIAIGLARGGSQYGFQSVANRAQDVRNVTEQMSSDGTENSRSLDVFFGRTFETTAQVIIDQTVKTQRYVGFDGVEALAYAFLPRFIAPNKPVIDDANEILARDYGFAYGMTRFPLTLVADGYRRGGALWVFFTGLGAGLALRGSARATLRFIGGDFGLVGLVMWSMICLRLYTESVWTLVSVLTYFWTKLVLQIVLFSAAARAAAALTESRGPR
jgi:hypothetical protein